MDFFWGDRENLFGGEKSKCMYHYKLEETLTKRSLDLRMLDMNSYNTLTRRRIKQSPNKEFHTFNSRVKLSIFGQTAKFGQLPCLFHSSVLGIKNKLFKQAVKLLMRRLIRSRLIWISTVCKCVSEFT